MSIRELNLTKEQHDWLNGWLELWGAWVYSGRLEKRMSSVIAKFMESVEPGRVMTRPMCNDDDGMLISQVVDSVMYIDKKAFGILLSYYAHGSSKRAIASYYHATAKPRKMCGRGGDAVSKELRATYNKKGEVIKATVNGKKIDPKKTYIVATIDYLANGGDYMTPMTRCKRLFVDTQKYGNHILEYIKQLEAKDKKIDAKDEVRIQQK